MVNKSYLEGVLKGPPPEEFDADAIGFVCLVSVNEKEGKSEGSQLVGLSYLIPRTYIILNGIGWWNIVTDGVFGE